MSTVKKTNNSHITCLIMLLALMVPGCVRLCYESPGRIRQAAQYTSQIPLTVNELKTLIDQDSNKYKLVVLYSNCCGACRKRFGDTYSQLWHKLDSSTVSWYFVQIDCGGVKWNEDFLKSYGISTAMYYLRDDSPEYLSSNGNITNCLFNRRITDGATATPTTYILDKNGTLKLAYYIYSDGTTSVEPMDLFHLRTSLEEIDFLAVDTLMWTF
ncbi:MAG: hypothetical protein KBT45_01485 [Bacteroidales bacterium]|nr:hypothetical protein [Candidatus Colimorpha pelethequi]